MYRQNTHGILQILQNISAGLGLFLGRFSQKNPGETWTHPPTSIVISDLWKKIPLRSPLDIIDDSVDTAHNMAEHCRSYVERCSHIRYVLHMDVNYHYILRRYSLQTLLKLFLCDS